MQKAMSLFLIWFSCSFAPIYAEVPFVKQKVVQVFINEMVKNYKFKKVDLIKIFAQVKFEPKVLYHLNKPLEIQPWYLYQRLFVTEWRVQYGVLFWNKYAEILKKVEKIYGVPSGIIVATIGVETKYGQRIGDYRVINALATIAFSNSPRANFFRQELKEFLLLMREQHDDPFKIMGSYAGAIGQPQFMPSSYRRYAIKFHKGNKIDLIHNEADVIASIANYYKQHGWVRKGKVASPAYMVGNRFWLLNNKQPLNKPLSVSQLIRFGVTSKNKSTTKIPLKMIELEGRFHKEYWLGFSNFDVIRRYNASDLYAMAVFQLSEYITELHQRLKKDYPA